MFGGIRGSVGDDMICGRDSPALVHQDIYTLKNALHDEKRFATVLDCMLVCVPIRHGKENLRIGVGSLCD